MRCPDPAEGINKEPVRDTVSVRAMPEFLRLDSVQTEEGHIRLHFGLQRCLHLSGGLTIRTPLRLAGGLGTPTQDRG